MNLTSLQAALPVPPAVSAALSAAGGDPFFGASSPQISAAVREPVSAAELQRAWESMLRDYPILRGSFAWRRVRRPLLLIHAESPGALTFHESLDEESGQSWESVLESERRGPFDGSAPPLARAVAAKAADGGWRLALTAHPLLLDLPSLRGVLEAWALRALQRPAPELESWESRYEAALAAAPVESGPGRLPEQDWGEAQTPLGALVSGDRRDAERARAERALSREAREAVARLRELLGVTPSAVFRAAWAVLVAGSSDARQARFATNLGPQSEAPPLGCFERLAGLRLEIEGDTASLIRGAESALDEARAAVDATGGALEGLLGSALLVRRSTPLDPALVDVLEREPWRFPFLLRVDWGDAPALAAYFDAALFGEEQASAILARWERIVTVMAERPEASVESLPLLTAEEEQAFLSKAKRQPAPAPLETALALFERQACQSPSAAALWTAEEALSYGELNARANRLARSLVARGVGPETWTAIVAERSSHAIVAMLAVLKTGGAYAPVDPNYPLDRLRYVLEDCGAAVILTEERLLERLPSLWAEVLCLDAEGAEWEREDDSNLDVSIDLEQAAYLIYTSGSSGRPKGVVLSHGNLASSLAARLAYYREPVSAYLLLSSFAFDSSVAGIYWTLASGGELLLPSSEDLRNPPALVEILERRAASHLLALPSLYQAILDAASASRLASLRAVVVAGEACPSRLVARHYEALPDAPLFNEYGPTEGTVWATVSRCGAEDARGPVPIGEPIANTRCYVLDSRLRPLPPGAPGELYLAGEGIARGYHAAPGLTAERFLPDPFAAGRIYRTGDRVVARPDGALVFLGRVDQQVKILGHRIELGEIEAVAAEHAAVEEAAASVRLRPDGSATLALYTTVRDEYLASFASEAVGSDYVERYESLYDRLYAEPDYLPNDPGVSRAIWKSSYGRHSLERQEIADCLDETAAHVLALRPRRALEIGCGSGALLLRIAPRCESYHGLDISAEALAVLRSNLAAAGLDDGRVTLERRAAHDVDAFLPGPFDVVLINEVVQHFPSVDYLKSLIESLLPHVEPGGWIVLGGVRSLPLLRAFYASVALSQAGAGGSRESLLQRIREQELAEKDLVVDPAFFSALCQSTPEISAATLLIKRARPWNEITKFQYDALLQVDGREEPERAAEGWLERELDGDDLDAVRRALLDAPDRVVAWRGVANARLEEETDLLAWLRREDAGELEAWRASFAPRGAFDPADWSALAAEVGRRVELHCSASGPPGSFDAVFHAVGEQGDAYLPEPPGAAPRRRWSEYANNPLRAAMEEALAPRLREWLKERLPPHSIPSRLLLLDAFPRTPNGKVDRNRLPAPDETAAAAPSAASAWPAAPIEEILAGVWARTLRIPDVGPDDNFFDIGGHSLLATQVIAGIRDELGVDPPLPEIFRAPTVRQLAVVVEELLRGSAPLPRLTPAPRDGDLPASFPQQRLWVLERFHPGGGAYVISRALRLRGLLDREALARALSELMRRHEALRTRIVEANGELVQRIDPPGASPLAFRDLSETPEPDREQRLQECVREECERPFELSRGPLFRVTLLALHPAEHVLAISLHHVVSDAWSVSVFVRELSLLYDAYVRDAPSPLPEPAFQYADFAHWQRTLLSGEALDAELVYWRDQLEGATALELPSDQPRPSEPSFRGAVVATLLDVDTTARVGEAARAGGATLFMTLLAGFAALLSRYTGRRDFVVGTPIANRTRGELDEVVGFFVNMLALRCDLSGDPSFEELLARIKAVCLEAYAHQHAPFEQVVEAIQPRRDPSRQPLFQMLFTLNNAPESELRLAGLAWEMLETPSETVKFDLEVIVEPRGRELAIVAHYSTDLFARETIERLLEHYRALLASLVAAPNRRVSEAPLLSAAELERETAEWNASKRPYERDAGLVELFVASAGARPDAVAVEYGEETLTYRDLDLRSDRLARRLVSLGVLPEARIGLCLPASPGFIVAILAVLKAGCAYLPLDVRYPSPRLGAMLRDAGAAVVLTAGARPDWLDESVATLDVLAAERDAADFDAISLPPSRGGSALAYVMYTSGSTGEPKGVAIEHRGVVRLVRHCDYAPIGPDDVVAQISNTSFDAATFEVWGALLQGAKVAGVSLETILEPEAFERDLNRLGATTMFITASLFDQIVSRRPQTFGCLRQLLVGGQIVNPEAVRRVLQHGPPARLLNAYGPTETTTFASWFPVASLPEQARSVPIGGPIANTTLYVLDDRLQPLPIGAVGEIYVGGDGVARGYWGRPSATAEAFLPDPYSLRPGARLYRTGDLARRRPDGAIELVGRRDRQVKLRGFRVELSEIELALLRAPGVSQAVVVVEPASEAREARIVAYAAPADGAAIDSERLRERLRGELPDYMLPAVVVGLERLPLTPNGKVDWAALPAPPPAIRPALAASDPVELALLEIWTDLLGVSCGPHDDFFALGGHSLLATRLLSRVRESFGVELPLRLVFEKPEASAMAAEIGSRRSERLPPIPRRDPEASVPLSFAQSRLWFLQRLHPESAAYNIPLVLRFGGAFDLDALGWALDQIVQRHEALRTVFPAEAGEPRQSVLESWKLDIPLEDLTARPAESREQALEQRLSRLLGRPFRLEEAPPLRAAIFRLAADEHVLAAVMHHIAFDGWSLGVLAAELSDRYAAFVRGHLTPLDELPVQYADYTLWQRRLLSSEQLQEQMAYWKDALVNAPALQLPLDRPRPAVLSERGAGLSLRVERSVRDGLYDVARQEGATLFMSLLSVYALVLSRLSGQRDLVVGAPIANRMRTQTEALIGFFVNTLALRIDLEGRPSFRELLRRVRRVALDAYARQDAPFEQVVEELQPPRERNRHPIFQALFALQNTPPPALSIPGVTVSAVRSERVTSKFDLSLSMLEAADTLAGELTYSTDLFDRESMQTLLACFEQAAEQAVAYPDRPVEALSLLSERDRASAVRLSGRDTLSEERSVVEMFSAWALETPEAEALRFGDSALSYGELDRRSDVLARALRRRGAGPESVVAIFLPRGLEAVVALLAIMKSGAAYLALDPDYPPERLGHLLRDCGARVLLSDGVLASRLPAAAIETTLLLDRFSPKPGEEAEPLPTVELDQLVYVAYTSGSTGKPKGIAMTHRGVANLIAWQTRDRTLGIPGRRLQFASWGFDASFREIFSTLCAGGSLVLASSDERRDVAALARLVVEQRCDKLQLPFVVLEQFAEEIERRNIGDLPLREVISAGERLEVTPAIRSLFERLPGCTFHNQYGPSETHAATAHALSGAPSEWPDLPPIGRAIDNMHAYVLDELLEPTPPGAPGELYLSGPGVARGYLNLPGMTAERFLPDPFSAKPGRRLYRTGDAARRRRDGTLEFLGRVDNQLKILGYRIEPGEIEAALRRVPGVRDCAVATSGAESRLAAYVVPLEPGALDAETLRQSLAEELPSYMIPTAFGFLDALPFTTHGKLDRSALPPLELAPSADEDYTPPRDSVELRLTQIWERVLGFGPISVRANFFELGGNSLAAVRLAALIADAFGVELPVAAVFELGNVEKMRALLLESAELPPQRTVVALRADGELQPIFFVHPAGGNVVCYAALARRLGGEHPVYGLQARGLDGSESPHRSVEEMARSYVEALLEVCPDGPFALGAWSLGGVVALEMAQQLRRAGRPVPPLLLLDCGAPALDARPEALQDADLLRHVARELAVEEDAIADSATSPAVERLLDAAKRAQRLPPDLDLEQGRRLLDVYLAFARAAWDYVAEPYDGDVVLFRAQEKLAREPDRPRDSGWGALVRGALRIHDAPGNHSTMVEEPHVGALAQAIRAALRSRP